MIRIGSVPYLNSKVLCHGLETQTPEYTFETHVPSVLSKKLRDGAVDIALVSSIEYFRSTDYVILPDLSVTGYREMWSIQLYHRVPLRQARRIGMDPSSETTNALLQIILTEKLNLGIQLVPLERDVDPLKRTDLEGFLKIGDPCLTFVAPPEYQKLDLSTEWHAFTNLPFVYAVWLARKGIDLEGVNKRLLLAKREGLRNTEPIARAEAPKLGLDYHRAKEYISKIVHYDLGRTELGGLELFRRYLVRQRLVPDGHGFDFYTR